VRSSNAFNRTVSGGVGAKKLRAQEMWHLSGKCIDKTPGDRPLRVNPYGFK
jgi:hypothetical protein